MKIKLKKPLKYKIEGKDIIKTELDLDFDKVTVGDICEAEENAKAMGTIIQNVEFTLAIQWDIVAKACGIPTYLKDDLEVSDFLKVCRVAKSFLLGME